MTDGSEAPSGLGGAVTVEELFPDEWVRGHTTFEDAEAFLAGDDAPGGPTGPGDDGWDDYVAETTKFEDWSGMLSAALSTYSSD